jgi:hypothetical protein
VPPSFGGYEYIVRFIDEWTRYLTVYPMIDKSEVLEYFQQFRIHFEKQYDQTIKSVHSDSGGIPLLLSMLKSWVLLSLGLLR